jgi:hypothetical protein
MEARYIVDATILGKQKQEDGEFEASIDYIRGFCYRTMK